MAEIKDFTSAIIEDLKALGFVWTSERIMADVVFDFLTRGDVQLFFQKGQLLEIRVGTRISIADMGKDNLSNKKLRDAFRAIDNSDNILNPGPGIGPEEMGNFKYWKADMQLGLKIPYLFHGESKESTPFYTQIYPDIVKITQISDTYKNFNELSFKDQLKQIGKDVKGTIFPKKNQTGGLKSQEFSKDGKIDILKLAEYDNLIQNPINEKEEEENLGKLIDLSTNLFESKPGSEAGKSPINPIETQSEEITKSSETIESKGPALEGKVEPNNIPAQDNVINPAKEEVKTEAVGSQSGDTYITTYNTSTVNDTVVNQTNTQNNIDERKKVNNFETTNVSELGGGTTVVNPVNEAAEEKKTESPTEEVEDVGPVLNTTATQGSITEEEDKEITLDDFLNSEYLEATNAYFGMTSNTAINNPVNSSTENVSESKSETSEENTELTSTLNEISQNLTTNTNTLNAVANTTNNKTSAKTPITEEEDKEITLDDFLNPEYLETTNAYFGKTSNTAINSNENLTSNSTNVSNENINSENVTSNMTEVKSGIDNLELNKTPVGLDKSVAPINTVNNTSVTSENMTQNKTEEINVNESSNPSNATSNVTTETIISNETNNQNNTEGSNSMMSSSSVGGSFPVDLSEVASRLRRLEDLLSGPLEVRVIN